MRKNCKLHERILIQFVYNGKWGIDDKGRIWRRINSIVRRRAEHPLGKGNVYLAVRAMVDGVCINGLAHRLVWQHFKGDIPNGFDINHKNGIKGDNRLRNLEPKSPSGNMQHSYSSGLRDQRGQRNPAATLTNSEVVQIRLLYSQGGITMEEIASQFGVTFQHVSRLVRGQQRTVQGGPIRSEDLRHASFERDPFTGRFTAFKLRKAT
jgi:hypothetical protein